LGCDPECGNGEECPRRHRDELGAMAPRGLAFRRPL
jgi:hypothetical protein